MQINLVGGWIAILAGLITGIGLGLFFHDERWLGGYASWPRRMLRLGHISLIGTGLLNIIPYGILLKLAFVGVSGWHWCMSGIPGMWTPFTVIDAVTAVLFVAAYLSLRGRRTEK